MRRDVRSKSMFFTFFNRLSHTHTPVLFTARPTEIPRFTILHSRIAEKASCSLVLLSPSCRSGGRLSRPPRAATWLHHLLRGSRTASLAISPLAAAAAFGTVCRVVFKRRQGGAQKGRTGKKERGGKEEGGCSNRTVAERQSDGSSTQRTSKARVLLSP